MLDIIGTPYSGINLSLSEGALISPADAQILIALKPGHAPTDRLRPRAAARAAPRVSRDDVLLPRARHLDAGAQLRARRADRSRRSSARSAARTRRSRSPQKLADRVAQGAGRRRRPPRAGRARAASSGSTSIARMAQQAGLTERDVASDLLVSLSSSGQVAPTFWLDKRGVQYLVAVQTPQYSIDSIDALKRDAALDRATAPQTLGNLATIQRARPAPRTSRTTTSRARSTSRPTSTAPISARSPTRSPRSSTRCAPTAPHGHADHAQGPGREHGQLVRGPALRPRVRDRCSSTC